MPEETLYSVFKQSTTGLRTARQEADKLKAINSTGRVDFVIQVIPITDTTNVDRKDSLKLLISRQ